MKNLSLKISFILLTFFSFTIQNSFSQDNDWNISLKQGLTYHFGKIYEDGGILDAKLSQFSIEAVYFDFGYNFSQSHEIGVSINKNLNTYPHNYLSHIQRTEYDTIFSYNSGYRVKSFIGIGIFYSYKFLSDLNIGFRIGVINPIFYKSPEDSFVNLFIGKSLPVSKSLSISSELNFSSRTRAFQRFRSQQVNLLLGINYGL
jgi:hypothetical protein